MRAIPHKVIILMGLDATGLELSPLFVFLGTIVEYIYKIFTSVLNFFYGDGDKESLGFFAFMLIVWFAFARLYDKYIQVHINKLRKKWFEN